MTPTPTIKEILAPLQPDMARTDEVIRRELHSDVALVRSIADYIIAAGGKRLRPALLLAVARALGYDGPHHATLAAVVEFIHTATLLHDDVVDESDLRRGRETANAVFGNAAAVLVGDFLYSRSFQMMVSVESMRVMAVLAEATNVIAEGEVLQLMNQGNPGTTLEDYCRVTVVDDEELVALHGMVALLVDQIVESQANMLTVIVEFDRHDPIPRNGYTNILPRSAGLHTKRHIFFCEAEKTLAFPPLFRTWPPSFHAILSSRRLPS